MGQFDEHKQKAVHKWRHFKEEREKGYPFKILLKYTERSSNIMIKSFGDHIWLLEIPIFNFIVKLINDKLSLLFC